MVEPWTRDERVRAEVVGFTPDVSGLVTQLLVHDNRQVRKGDLLLRIDSADLSPICAKPRPSL